MSWQDEIANKRKEAQAAQAGKQLHSESINAVNGSGEKVAASTRDLAKSQDIDSLIEQVKEVQLAAMLGASKPSIVLTDNTDLGDKMSELATKVADTIKQLDSSDSDTQQLGELKSVGLALIQLRTTLKSGNESAQKSNTELLKAIKSLNISPVVNVPAPKVTVESSKVDLSPINDTLKQYFEAPKTEKVDLECYRAQDIDNADGNIQYVGFVNPEGNWYIIENDVAGNRMRYVFGVKGYEKAFKRAATYQYSLLNEAVNALTS